MDKLDVILLIGRPAAGKSETIDFLKHLPDEKRLQEYHIAPFDELDDFLYVWQTLENDAIRQSMGLAGGTRTTPCTFWTTASGTSSSNASIWISARSWRGIRCFSNTTRS